MQQARAVAFRTREQFIDQRTEAINALRSHLYEFGYVAQKGPGNLPRLAAVISDENTCLPDLVRDVCRDLLEQIGQLTARLKKLKSQIEALAREGETSHRLQTMPGVGPITALAIETFAPPMSVFKRGRDFAAWLGLVPRQHSSGGKQRMGKTSRMGQRDIRRLLIIGAMSVVIPSGNLRCCKRRVSSVLRLILSIDRQVIGTIAERFFCLEWLEHGQSRRRTA